MNSIQAIITEVRKLQDRVTALEASKVDIQPVDTPEPCILEAMPLEPDEKKMTQSEKMKEYWRKRKAKG